MSFISIVKSKLIIQPVYQWRSSLYDAKGQHWLGRLIVEVSVSQLDTHIRQYFSEWVISSSQRPLPTQNKINTREEHPHPQRVSSRLSQKF